MRSFQSLLLLILLLGCSKSSDSDSHSTPNTPPQPKRYSLTVSVTPSEGGVVSPSSGTFEEGTVVKIEGTPSTGYLFREWSGDIQGTDNTISVTMDSNKSITGTFEMTPEFSYKESIINLRNRVLEIIRSEYEPSWSYSFDLENDGDMDMILIRSGPWGSPKKEMILFRNENNKGFEEIHTGIDCWGRTVVFDDFNGDGLTDFFVPDHGYDQPPYVGGQDQMIYQTPDGNLIDMTNEVLPELSNFSHGGTTVDLENDGDLDLITNCREIQYVLRNNNGIFEVWDEGTTPILNGIVQNVDSHPTIDGELRLDIYDLFITGWWSNSGDFNNDGYEDVIIGGGFSDLSDPPDGNGVRFRTIDMYGNVLEKSDLILLQDPDTGQLVYNYPNSLIPTSYVNSGQIGVTAGILVNDFNSDGCLDFITQSYERLELKNGNCDGGFETVKIIDLPVSPINNDNGWENFQLIDVDQDGDLDVIISNDIQWNDSHLISEEHVVLVNENGELNFRLGETKDLINLPPHFGISWYLDGE